MTSLQPNLSVPGIRVHQAAIAIEVVQASRQAEAPRPEGRFVDFAVVGHGLHDLVGEIIVEAEPLAEIALEAEETSSPADRSTSSSSRRDWPA